MDIRQATRFLDVHHQPNKFVLPFSASFKQTFSIQPSLRHNLIDHVHHLKHLWSDTIHYVQQIYLSIWKMDAFLDHDKWYGPFPSSWQVLSFVKTSRQIKAIKTIKCVVWKTLVGHYLDTLTNNHKRISEQIQSSFYCRERRLPWKRIVGNRNGKRMFSFED